MIHLLALGGNMPFEGRSPDETIAAAWDELFQFGVQVVRTSNIYRTPCFPAGAGPDFSNAAAKVEFGGSPQELLDICHQVERRFGRERNARWSARTLDIDLLAVGETIHPDEHEVRKWIEADLNTQKESAPDGLILPHPRIQDRAFVLVPLNDVAPNWRHPILCKTVSELLDLLPTADLQAISLQ